MKTLISITIDQDLVIEAKSKTDNLSGTINFLLRRWVENEAEEYERNRIAKAKQELDKKIAEIAALKAENDRIKQELDKNKTVREL